MPKQTKVAIGLVSYGTQEPSWYIPVMEELAHLSHFNIELDEIFWQGSSDVACNRNQVVHDWEKSGKSEWLWWIDSDNPPGIGSLARLLQLHEPAVSGLYYSGTPKDKMFAIAYVRNPDNSGYIPYPVDQHEGESTPGEIKPVDAVGMGCFLTNRSVYEDIRKTYTYLQRKSGGILPIRKDAIIGKVTEEFQKHDYADEVHKGMYYDPVLQLDFTKQQFPYFLSQYNRTEDMPFCEMVRGSGNMIWLDTTVEVGHVKPKSWRGEDYRNWAGRPSDEIVEEELYV